MVQRIIEHGLRVVILALLVAVLWPAPLAAQQCGTPVNLTSNGSFGSGFTGYTASPTWQLNSALSSVYATRPAVQNPAAAPSGNDAAAYPEASLDAFAINENDGAADSLTINSPSGNFVTYFNGTLRIWFDMGWRQASNASNSASLSVRVNGITYLTITTPAGSGAGNATATALNGASLGAGTPTTFANSGGAGTISQWNTIQLIVPYSTTTMPTVSWSMTGTTSADDFAIDRIYVPMCNLPRSVVTNTGDSGMGTLRDAIIWANANPGPITITFAISGAGPHSITLSSALPDLTASGLTIDGTTQSGTQCRDLWAGSGHDLRINLRGSSSFDGLRLGGANQTVRGLSISGFSDGLELLAASSGAIIQCSYIGLLADGASNNNAGRGVNVFGSGARIGGLGSGEGNVISSNNSYGVQTNAGSTDTAIRNNFLGTDAAGGAARPNGTAINNQSGTATWRDITRNLIAANNGSAGIILEPDDRVSPSDGQIRIQGNVIGTNRTITALLRNGGDGILFDANSITGALIGGTGSAEGNIITANDDGIDLRSVSNITIRGNTIAIAVQRGINLNNVSTVEIGGASTGQGNTIGGNGNDGIYATNSTSNLTILGNLIQPIATIGGTFANSGHGIWLDRTSNVVIGNGTAAGRNVIGGNLRRGIQGSDTNSGVTINGNYIGTDATGNAAVTNGQNEGATSRDAISFQGGTHSNVAVLNNVIGGYSAALVEFWDTTVNGLTIQGNNLGVGANGTSQITSANTDDLIYMGGTTRNFSNVLIGGTGAGQANTIAFGNRSGVRIDSTGTSIQVIGNTIRNNTRNGIYVVNTVRASLLGNRIFANGLLGIDLGDNGVTTNDAGDGDSGPNSLLNFPVVTGLFSGTGGSLTYNLTLDVPAETNGYRIDFYRNPTPDSSTYGEGEQWLGFIETTAHPGGSVAYSGTFTPLVAVSVGDNVAATATRKTGAASYGETSEFNPNAGVAVSPLIVTNVNDSGAGSLRNAIDFANTQTTPSTISFNIPGAGPHAINLLTALPIMTANGMTIDGITQPGAQCRDLWLGNGHDLRINVRRSAPSPNIMGLRLAGANQTVRGLSLTRLSTAVQLEATSTNARVQCNYIGTLPIGTTTESNSLGVSILGASALIGGPNSGDGNVIAGNAGGIRTNNGSTDTSIQGNFIGTDAAGMASRINGTGIRAFSTTSGSSTWRSITGNLISGNNSGAIVVDAAAVVTPSTDLIRIQGNVIGFNRDRSALLLNTRSGINFDTGTISNVLIGGAAATEGNLIAGTADGLSITNAANITIQGNIIARSGGRGIALVNVNGAAIGGTAGTLGNIISGNTGNGIDVTGGSNGVSILGNTIGSATVTGGTYVNGGHGIMLDTASNVQIGDGTAAGRNVIGGNGGRGIFGSVASSNVTISGNYIGTDSTGNVSVAGGQNQGISQRDAIIFESANVSNIAILNNVIGGYGTAMIKFNESTANGVIIRGNSIGVGANGSSQLISGTNESLIAFGGNTRNYANVRIGGLNPGEGNLLANGGQNGITINSAQTGIEVIGNTIRNNTGNGVLLINPTRAAIIANRIFANGMLGIDLGTDGVTANDAGDGDSGANDLLNFPQGVRAIVNGPNALGYSFALDAPAAANGYRVDFFASSGADPSGFGEGERFLGHVDITHAGGAQSFTGTLATLQPIAIGDIITTTTTRRTGGGSWDITSEFSAVATADGIAALTVAMTSQVFEPPVDNPFATPGNDILLTTTVSNNGNGSTDADSIFVAISIDPANTFFNGVTAALGGVVGLTTGAPALTFTPGTDLRFSNSAAAPAAFAQCTYTPVAGYDPAVRHVCVNPKGILPSGGPQGQFALQLRVRIN